MCLLHPKDVAMYVWGLQGAVVDGPVPAPDLAPAVSAKPAPVMAPAPSASANNPLSFLVNVSCSILARERNPHNPTWIPGC